MLFDVHHELWWGHEEGLPLQQTSQPFPVYHLYTGIHSLDSFLRFVSICCTDFRVKDPQFSRPSLESFHKTDGTFTVFQSFDTTAILSKVTQNNHKVC